MKRITLSLAAAGLGLAAGAASAETSVTLYGIADVSIRYVNTSDGQTGQDGSRIAMANGAISNSRWGLRGSEDLGDGNRAFFRLEQGFNVQNGKASDTSKTFNRLAYVGLDGGKIGALTLGLQNTVIQDLMADYFDPLTVGNYNENSWLPAAMGRVRTNNAFRYSNTLGDLAVAAQWANGDKWSDRAAGQQMGISLRYTVGQLGLGGAFQKTFGANDSDLRQQVWNLSASYQFESAKIFAGYFNGRDQTGWVNAVMGGTTTANLDRKDNGYFAGVTWQATPRWAITGAAYYDQSKNVVVDGDKGKRYALVAVAEYSLSKRTQVYGTVDYNKVRDAVTGEIAGRTSQIGAGLGMRHIF
ncbi:MULTISPECIES: porin [Achromobacter]|uniref:porin n=1 Tax=Achromobacter TaxID=222 RepID=UPI0006C085A4|nr:porin [Achromobacter sp. 2789STDY5608615]MCG2599603.1 porin [Achromobacter sp.]MCG2602874.1 porin [Achromobacter sp.]CUK10894.1 Outer membrane porin protein BP0840 precursor [Achromobacter sp. 2789STDY5608615]